MPIDDFRDASPLVTARAASAATASHGAFISVAASVSEFPGQPAATGPLAGIPFAVKDNIDVAGFATTGGTELLRHSRPAATSSVVLKLTRAGGVVTGKTNLHELAFGITSNNGSFGPVRNPHDPSRSAGGSSGGSAVAVALGVVPFALGTDTGGSMQIPAAHCGVVGMRPSVGRYGSDGVLGLSATRDTIGVMATTVGDVAFVDAIISGQNDVSAVSLTTVRLGVPTAEFFAAIDPRITERFVAHRALLEAAGVTVVEYNSEPIRALAELCGTPITFYESAREIVAYLRTLPLPLGAATLTELRDASLSPDVRGILTTLLSHPVSDAEYHAALEQRAALQRLFASVFEGEQLDALFYPTVALLAPPLGDDETTLLNGKQVATFDFSIRHTGPGSIAGLPAISIPGGLVAGLPVGLTLEAAPGSDRRLLSLAAAVESIRA